MEWWALGAAVLVAAVVVLVLLPVRLRLSLQGRGEPNGFWALAGAVALGPVVVSGLAARGVPAQAQLRVFGRQIGERRLADWLAKRRADHDAPEADGDQGGVGRSLEKARARYHALTRRLDPVELLVFLTRERRRIEVERLEIDLGYSFADIVLTGKLLGAIYAVSGLLPPNVVVRQCPIWQFEDKASVACEGTLRLWPGLLVVDSLWFLVTNVRLRGRAATTRDAPKAA